jgi:hypothetical protein
MARKLTVFSSLMSNYSFNNNFCQKVIIYLDSLYNTLYFDIKFISEYWKMNSKSWQDGLFHGTKWRENYQCSRLWCQIILLMIISVKRWLYIWKVCKNSFILIHISFFFKPIKYKHLDRTDFYLHLESESRTKNKSPDDSRSTKWYLNGWLWFLSNKFICF